MRPAVPPTHRQDIMIAARREPLPPPPPPPCPTSFSSFPHAWGTYTYGHQHNQMAVQLIPRRTSRFPTPLKGRAQVACPRQTSRTHCKRCVYFFKKKKRGTGRGTYLLCLRFTRPQAGRKERASLQRTRRLLMAQSDLSCTCVLSTPRPFPFPSFPLPGVTDLRKRMLDG
jgi:hypothetical protein